MEARSNRIPLLLHVAFINHSGYTEQRKRTAMASGRSADLPPLPEDYEPPRQVSHEEYLRLTEDLPGKYEYHAGLMYPRFYPPGSHWAMAGGTVAHDDLIVRLITELSIGVGRRGPCKVHTADMKLLAGDHDYFPDAYVTCGPTSPQQTRLEDAAIICEVRSQSTAEFDREAKFEAYKRLPGLREYLILDNRRPQVSLFRKEATGAWTYLMLTAGATVRLDAIDLSLSVDALYEGISLDPDPTRPDTARTS
jgi:Uma2 family endonuclease